MTYLASSVPGLMILVHLATCVQAQVWSKENHTNMSCKADQHGEWARAIVFCTFQDILALLLEV